MPDLFLTHGDGMTNPRATACVNLTEALKLASRHGGYVWREVDGMVEVWSNLDGDLWGWEPAEPEMAAFLRESR